MSDVQKMKARFSRMLVGDLILILVALGFAIAHFVYGVSWALWGFTGFLAAAFALQVWFVRGFARTKKGG